MSYTPPFPLLLSLPPLSLLWILLALASLPSWGLGYHGNRRNALFCSWLAISSRWISAPLCSALKRGWCFAWNVKQWARDYPPWSISLSLSPYVAHSHACALSCCLAPLSLSLSEFFSSRLSLNSCCLNESSLGARTIFIFPARLMPLCLPDYPQVQSNSPPPHHPHRNSELSSGCSFRYYCNSNSDPFLFLYF